MPARRPGAPRLIEWTGERLVPWAPDVQVVYEHFHRYLWAQPLVAGRRVLDLASGEGFGSALLAESASAVLGVDVDARTIEHATANYAAQNLRFEVAAADDLSGFDDASFGAVVAFEMIEHVADQVAVLREVVRVLAPDGLLIISTPERRAYSDATGFVNPYHEHELTLEELSSLLETRFENVAMFSQRAVTGSRIEAFELAAGAPHHAVRLERSGDEWREAGAPDPLYIVAVASDSQLPALPASSTLSDYGLALVDEARAQERAVRDRREAELIAIREEREAELLAERERLIVEVTKRTREREEAHARAQLAEDEARRVTESVTWRALERARAVLARIPMLERALRRVTQLAFRGSRRSAAPRG